MSSKNTFRFLTIENPEAFESLLMRLRYKEATLVEVESDKTLLLDDPNVAWLVYSGSADVFLATVEEKNTTGTRQFMFSIKIGNLMLGFDPQVTNSRFLVNSSRGTKLLKIDLDNLKALAEDEVFGLIVTFLLDRWVLRLSQKLIVEMPPHDFSLLPIYGRATLKANEVGRVKEMAWAKLIKGQASLMGHEDLSLPENIFIPLSNVGWMNATKDSTIDISKISRYGDLDSNWEGLTAFQNMALAWFAKRAEQLKQAEQFRIQRKKLLEKSNLNEAFLNIANTLGLPKHPQFMGVDTEIPLLTACNLVAEFNGLKIVAPPELNINYGFKNPVYHIALYSRIRARKVALSPNWWQKDSGAILGYINEDKRPVALLPIRPGRYEIHDPTLKTITPITQENAHLLEHFGTVFYPRFEDKPIGAWDLFELGLKDMGSDRSMIFFIGIMVGLLNIVTPLITRLIFDDILPSGNRSDLFQVGIALLLTAFAVAALSIAQSIAVLRVQSRAEGRIQSAVWDRLLSLPPSFFRDYGAGDLATRAMGISLIRKLISGTVTMSILAGIFSIFNLALLFYYNIPLAILALILVLIATTFTLVAGYLSLRIQRVIVDQQGKISAHVLQFINGISKFRVANAQDQVFAIWANEFSEQRKNTFRSRSIENWQYIFHAVYPVLAMMALFATIEYVDSINLSVGTFVAFYAAFTQFLTASLQLSGAILVIIGVIPIFEHAKPILETLPEIDVSKSNPGELSGKLEVSHVSFSYQSDSPKVLHDVSIKIEQGEFVALVGASGCGKSTLMRLLLGFEKPSSGVVYYDGKDLADLDLQLVRRQIGVVLQNSQLMSGSDIFSNIVGATNLTMDDAWEAARMAGLEQDIKDMPMRMHTILSQGGTTISGGQRQRLLIARAIVTRPRLLFFDEATSSLDNKTQAIVSESLERLDATRIVIAHRLSTIINADHIIVMDKGEVVQSGTYKELIRQAGKFQELSKQQLI